MDVISVTDAGTRGASDETHLSRAAEGRVLITRDADFLRLHDQGWEHADIGFIPYPLSVGEMIRRIERINLLLTSEQMRGRVEFL